MLQGTDCTQAARGSWESYPIHSSRYETKELTHPAVEHSTTPADNNNNDNTNNTRPPPRRPDLSSFFATLQEITPNPSEVRTRPYAVPVPGDISAAYRSLAEALNVMRHETGEDGFPVHDGRDEGLGNVAEDGDATGGAGLLSNMIGVLLREAEEPPREVEGVGEGFCDGMLFNYVIMSTIISKLSRDVVFWLNPLSQHLPFLICLFHPFNLIISAFANPSYQPLSASPPPA